MDWAALGSQIRTILETTFDGVATSVVYYPPTGGPFTLRAMVGEPLANYQREHLEVDEAGIVDQNVKRIAFKTNDILQVTGAGQLDGAGYITINDVRYDFHASQPLVMDDFTPLVGALKIFSVYFLRRAEELNRTLPQGSEGGVGQFEGWST